MESTIRFFRVRGGTRAEVIGVVRSAPAADVLEAGDTIVAVSGRQVTAASELSDPIHGRPAGTRFTLTVERDGVRSEVTVRSADLLDAPDDAGGRAIAATGTIDAEGHVGEVGAVAEEAIAAERAGADVFLVPASEMTQADDTPAWPSTAPNTSPRRCRSSGRPRERPRHSSPSCSNSSARRPSSASISASCSRSRPVAVGLSS